MARRRGIFLHHLQSLLATVRGQGAGGRGQKAEGRKRFFYSLLVIVVAVFCVLLPGLTQAIAIKAPAISQNAAPASLVQQGKTFYDAGQYADAIKVLQQAVKDFQAQGATLQQAMALSNLSLAQQQLGQWQEAQQAVSESLNLLREPGSGGAGKQTLIDQLQIFAQTLDVQGRLQLARGQAEPALESWQQAAKIYAQLKDGNGETRSRINQAQALQTLGLYRRALTTLTELNQTLQTQPDSLTKAAALRSLGDALQVVGDLEQSRQALAQSLTIAQTLKSDQNISLAQFSLGNTTRAQAGLLTEGSDPTQQAERQALTQAALDYYQQAVTTSPTLLTKVQAQLNQLSLLLDRDRQPEAQTLAAQISPQLDRLPPNRAAIYARINFAQSQLKLQKGASRADESTPASSFQTAAQLLATAAQQAKQLGDRRAESYALGSLGGLYEQTGQRQTAQDLTEQALVLAQTVNAADVTYRWQWQMGRLLRKDQLPKAVAAYDAAVATLQSLRSDLVAVNPEVQFSFRESVEPIYRQSVELLLQSEENPSEKTLDKARQRIESLQLAELDNFFREACLNAQTVVLDQVVDQDNPTAAIIYPIILPDKLQVIVKVPNQPLQNYTIDRPQSEIERVAKELREAIVDPTQLRKTQTLAQSLYGWLIQPIAASLEQNGVKTLVFVPDGALRSVPMAALYDGKQYLVEKYSVALSLGLQLLDPKPLERKQLRALAAGLVQPPPDYSQFLPLQEIAFEFNLMEAAGVSTSKLLEFTSQALEKEINAEPFSVVHLATHGQFSSQAKDTFILAADGPINVNQLDNLLRSRDQTRSEAVELLVLSACQTAAGDSRATLGLAGIAIRAGARSTLASLWQIDDRATALFIGEFYQELADPKVTKAEALRQAQLNLRQKYPDYSDPGFWAPYVLIGNWL